MKIRGKFITPILAVLSLAALVGILILVYVFSAVLDQQTQHSDAIADDMFVRSARTQAAEVGHAIDSIANNALVQATIFAQMPEVQSAYQLALTGNMDDEFDPTVQAARQQLRSGIKDAVQGYQQLLETNDLRLHFHLPNSRSFVRSWRDGWQITRDGQRIDVSDDLSAFRKTLVALNQDKKRPITGIEVGVGGLVVRGIVPVTARDGRHLGTCEVYYSFDAVMQAAHTTDNFQMAVFMDKGQLAVATSLNDPQKYPPLGNDYIRIATTKAEAFSNTLTTELLHAGRGGVEARFVGENFITTFPIHDYSGQVIGVFALNYDTTRLSRIKSEMMASAESAQNNVIIGLLVGVIIILLFVALVIFIVSGSVTKPLGCLMQALTALHQRDLTYTVPTELCRRTDEIGEMARAVDEVINGLEANIKDISANADTLSTASNDLSAVSNQTVQSVRTLSERTSSVAAAAEETSANTDSVAEGMGQATNNLSSVAGATEEMSATVSEIAGNTEKARRISEQAMQQAQGVTSTMQELGAAAREIDRVTETITEISSQTNLLALNATIEAARAGEAGKGFAVVAGEIKELARQTADATEDIKRRISGIQASTGSAVTDIDQINQVIREVGELVNSIAAAIEEQSTVTRDLAGNIAQVSAGVQDANERVSQTAGVARAMARDIAEVNTAAADIRSGGEQVQSSAAELSQLAEQLKQLVGQFRVN